MENSAVKDKIKPRKPTASTETRNLLHYENLLATEGFSAIAGTDEAGRGPLAGPVFAAAVVLPRGKVIPGVDDSKKLTEKKREELFDIIKQTAVAFAIAACDEKEIDTYNILGASMLAMRRAVYALDPRPDFVIVDGNRLPELEMPALALVKGDSLSLSVAAASILAKVARDRYMVKMAELYPDYAFEKHKGYPTKLHFERIREHGICPIHRRTFLKKILSAELL